MHAPQSCLAQVPLWPPSIQSDWSIFQKALDPSMDSWVLFRCKSKSLSRYVYVAVVTSEPSIACISQCKCGLLLVCLAAKGHFLSGGFTGSLPGSGLFYTAAMAMPSTLVCSLQADNERPRHAAMQLSFAFVRYLASKLSESSFDRSPTNDGMVHLRSFQAM